MKRLSSVVVAMLLFGWSLASIAGPTTNRTGSSLDVTLDGLPQGAVSSTYSITDSAGHDCADGTVPSDGHINIPKIASDVDLTVAIKDASGNVVQTINVAAIHQPSSLAKLAGDVTIYQVPIRTYFATDMGKDKTGTLNDFSSDVMSDLKDLGADYIWVTGALAPATPDNSSPSIVKGEAGSYYAIANNWDVNPTIGTLDDFSSFIDRAHAAGLRVLIDLVVNHTARLHRTDVACKVPMDFGKGDDTTKFFAQNNNYFYIQGTTFVPPSQTSTPAAPLNPPEAPAKVTGNNITSAQPRSYDWYDTVKLNYGYDFTTGNTAYSPRPKTWDQMLDVASYWVDKGVDGFRIDFAHAVPVEFWRYFVPALKAKQPNIFLVAEAYEQDVEMKAPGFTYEAFFDAGIDSIFNSELFTLVSNEAQQPGTQYNARLVNSPALRDYELHNGYTFTNFLENHDQVRIASRYFAPNVGDRDTRAKLGLAFSAFEALMPAHFLMQGGQELEEDASVMGPYNGDNGKTSIFDFVYQSETLAWLTGTRPQNVATLRGQYKALLGLKHQQPFNLVHSTAQPSFIDLHEANWTSQQSYWIGSYLRYSADGVYLVVINSDPFNGHDTTIHFTYTKDQDPLGALAAAGMSDNNQNYKFTEVFSQPGFVPKDPALPESVVPGWVLFSPSGVPSGLYLGTVPPATTYVFKVEPAS